MASNSRPFWIFRINSAAEEIIGENFSRFYTPEDREAGLPQQVLKQASEAGRFAAEGWRVRKDGSRFWAMVVVDPIREGEKIVGFAKVTRDMTEHREATLAALETSAASASSCKA